MRTFISCGVLAALCLLAASPVVGEEPAPATLNRVTSLQLITNDNGVRHQYVRLNVTIPGEPASGVVSIEGFGTRRVKLNTGEQNVDVAIPVAQESKTVNVALRIGGKSVGEMNTVLRPVRNWVVYLLPHSHVDIGYTKVQTEVEADQVKFLGEAIAEAKRTAEYPEGSRFKWNSEVMWAVDGYLRTATPEQKTALIDAVNAQSIGLDAMYGNELTGLCRPEELVRLMSYATRMRGELGVPVDTAMISDVPGYTWGLMTVFAQSGIKYFSVGPNRSDRIGTTLTAWGDRPFYWVSPSGQEKVLVWIAAQGYSWFHGKPGPVGDKVLAYLNDLEDTRFPYDMVELRYNIGGDNGPPDTTISDAVKDWNAKYETPKLQLALVREFFQEFENCYGSSIPAYAGDMTPYWEDGAASSARETALARDAAERLVQAETLWSILQPQAYPMDRFREAWRNVILYDEHTWGAHNSISEPDSDFVKAQWDIKKAFADDADRQARALLDEASAPLRANGDVVDAVLVFNTSSWARTQLVTIPAATKLTGDKVLVDGAVIPSQRLSNGDLAFVAKDVPALGSKRFAFAKGKAKQEGAASVDGWTIGNGLVTATVHQKNGTITSLTSIHSPVELVDTQGGAGLNEYLYVQGTDPKGAMRAWGATVKVVDQGPVVATMNVTTGAPSTNSIVRELRVVDGIAELQIANFVDKHKQRRKEGVHFAYPFNVPDGVVRTDMAWSVVRPEHDQLPGSCKNWMTVQRWVDVSNQNSGVTLATIDAPLIELGGLTAESPWMTRIEPTQTIVSYVMNNYWHTNYRDSQEGLHVFRYALRPHGVFEMDAAQKFGVSASQPLIVVPVNANAAEIAAPIQVSPDGVMVTALKRSEDGKATIVRLFSGAGLPVSASITGRDGAALQMWASDLTEKEGAPVTGPIDMPAFGIATLRIAL